MVELNSIVEKFTQLNKIIEELKDIKVRLDDVDKAILMLSLLPSRFEHFKDALIYGNENIITLDDVQ